MILAVGLIPAPASVQITDITIEMNYKMVLNVLAIGLFLFLYWRHRSESVEVEDGHGEHTHGAD